MNLIDVIMIVRLPIAYTSDAHALMVFAKVLHLPIWKIHCA